MENDQIVIATYEDVKDIPNHPKKILVDVREPAQLEKSGKIPFSINIPSTIFEQEMQLSEPDFLAKYNREKPKLDDEIIFHCGMGGRAGKVTSLALSLGYKSAKSYKGGWSEWSKKEAQ